MGALKFISQRIIYLLLLSVIAIFAFILANLSETVEVLCKQMVHKSLISVNFELDNYFNPIKEDLIVAVETHEDRVFYPNDFRDFNKEFEALIANKPHLSSILLSTTEGDEYMIMDGDSCWITRSTFKGSVDSLPSKYFWSKEDGDSTFWHEKFNEHYDPRERPWFKQSIDKPLKSIHWTEPYTFFTSKEPGITLSTAWKNSNEDRTMVTAFDVLLSNIADFTSKMKVSDNGFVFILTDNGKTIGLPANCGFDSEKERLANLLISYEELNVDPINVAMKMFKEGMESDTSFRFESKGAYWWGDLEEYYIGEKEKFIVGVVVPESDFVGTVIQSRNFIIIGFVVIFIITIFLIKVYRDKHKKNEILREQKAEIFRKNGEITLQKHEIEEKKHEILDSINYAKRIQEAILPPEIWMEDTLGDCFVMYLPKDIVAGDFYWVEPLGEKVLFAAADCTGHGVPGAMVSVVCHNALNRAVREFSLTKPADILNKVTEIVIETFKNSEEQIKDGMDISLCSFDRKNKVLEYAGAHNPLWLIRPSNLAEPDMEVSLESSGITMYEKKADKQPVAQFSHWKPFTNHVIPILDGDVFYLSSDGYPDQFGGERGKKLKSKNFKKKLMAVQHLPLREQEVIIHDAFLEWKGDFEQLDDVCVIGVRV